MAENSSPSEPSILLGIFGLTGLVLGLVAGLISLWQGDGLWSSAGIALGTFVCVALLGFIIDGIRAGHLSLRGGVEIYRAKTPALFWGCAVFYVLIGGAALVGLVFLFLELFS